MKLIYSIATFLIVGCINPLEGDFGIVEVVPEVDSCQVLVEDYDMEGGVETRYETRACEDPEHDIKFLGRKWFQSHLEEP